LKEIARYKIKLILRMDKGIQFLIADNFLTKTWLPYLVHKGQYSTTQELKLLSINT